MGIPHVLSSVAFNLSRAGAFCQKKKDFHILPRNYYVCTSGLLYYFHMYDANLVVVHNVLSNKLMVKVLN